MKLKTFISLIISVIMIFSTASIAFAADSSHSNLEFGDVICSEDGITVFYGNPADNEELAKKIEEQHVARSLQYDNSWVDANTSTTRYLYITASSSNPITYFNIKQESTSAVPRSRVTVQRPNNDGICYTASWNGRSTYQTEDLIISSSTLWDQPFFEKYTWKSGTLKLTWTVETGNSGARMCLWAW